MRLRRHASIAVLPLLAPMPALAQQLGGGAGPDVSAIRIVAALVVCVAAALALALFISRRGRPSKISADWLTAKLHRGRIAVLETRRVSAHADICLVHCDGKEYLLACGSGDIRVLSEIDAAAPPPAGGV